MLAYSPDSYYNTEILEKRCKMSNNNNAFHSEPSTRHASFTDSEYDLVIAVNVAINSYLSNTQVLPTQWVPHAVHNVEVNLMHYVEMSPLPLCEALYSWCTGCDF